MKSERVSIVIPAYNEKESLPLLWGELKDVLPTLTDPEVIFVDDGSTDGSTEVLRDIVQSDSHAKLIVFNKNYGQTLAMGAGVRDADGDIIVILDSDLQNDPKDIPLLLSKLSEGYDVVSGWRKNRWQGQAFSRKIPSVLANWLISWMTGLKLHDAGCQLKAYRREVLSDIDFVGEIHRLIHVHAFWQGAKIGEIIVNDRPRKFGESKYGFSRIIKLPLDLLVAKFTYGYSTKPIYFFGTAGISTFIIGLGSFLWATYLRFVFHISYIETPLLLLTVLMLVIGLQLISMGLLADMILRTRNKEQTPYRIREKIGF